VVKNSVPIDELVEDGVKKYLFRLDGLFADYFTHFQVEFNPENQEQVLLLTKLYPNYSNFMFYQEHDTVIKVINEFFGSDISTEELIEEFKVSKDDYPSKEYLINEKMLARLVTDRAKFYLYIHTSEK
jgi:hypothetical protein